MADSFFDGGQLPPQFNRASGIEPEPEPKRPDDPELNYDPPEPSPPGLGPTVTPTVTREELDGPSRDAIQQAQDRMDRGETEMGDQMLTQDFNRVGWTSQEIEEVQQEDQGRSLDFENEWDEQAQRDYERYSLEAAKERYDERWGEKEEIDDHERFDESIDQSEELDEQDQEYSDFLREQNAEIDATQDTSIDQGPEHDPDIEH